MKDETRREFLKKGLTLTGGVAASSAFGNTLSNYLSSEPEENDVLRERGKEGREKRPNIMMIITDQQRQSQHWPTGWIEEHMPTMSRLQENGVTFTNSYTVATACSPSRASFLSGVYPSVHGLNATPPNPPMRTDITNIFKLAEKAGYNVAYKGKMHLFTPQGTISDDNFSSYDMKWAADNYGFKGWNPPDCALNPGGDVWISGGYPDNDDRYVSGVPDTYNRMTPAVGNEDPILKYLDNFSANSEKPFLLVCSFGNPHDISVWPDQEKWGYNREDYINLREINLPSNYNDDLSEKPMAQREFQKLTDKSDPCPTEQDRLEYCRFYAHLHSVVDKQIEQVLDKLDERKLTDDTIIFRFADHGEQCWSHQMIQKGLNSYQETINVPLIISNPKLFPEARTTSSFASLIDLVPTIVDIMGSETSGKLNNMGIYGKSLMPVLENPDTSVRDNIMFYSEDFAHFFNEFLGMENVYDTVPGNIRSIRHEDWLYAVYFTNSGNKFQYEMYNLTDDPGEMKNLAWGNRLKANRAQMQVMHDRLTAELETYSALPSGFDWPSKAGARSV